MSNEVRHEIELIEVPMRLVQPVFKCLFQTVFFLRDLGFQEPKDEKIENLEITYAAIKNDELDKKIDEILLEKMKTISKLPNDSIITSSLSFYSKVEQKRFSFFTSDKYVWEKWDFKVKIVEDMIKKKELKQQIEMRLKNILDLGQQKYKHIPALDGNTGISKNDFHYEIVINSGKEIFPSFLSGIGKVFS